MNVLLFERDFAFANSLARELAMLAGPENNLRLTWFSRNFGWRSKQFPPSSYPIVVEPADAPIVLDALATNFKQKSRETEWWQEAFDAAILDTGSSEELGIGRRYADWLSLAEFTGPVVFATSGRRAVSQLQRLQSAIALHKGSASFSERAWKHIQDGIKRGSRQLHVNYRGREPSHILKAFYSRPLAPQRWDCAYFGRDAAFAVHLSTFFDTPFHDGEALHALKDMGKTLANAGKRQRGLPRLGRPQVVWVDCGDEDLRDEQVEAAFEATRGLAYLPIVAFAAQSIDLERSQSLLDQMNAFVAPREELARWPAFWAGSAIDRLSASYGLFRDLAHSHGIRLAVEKRQDWSTLIEPAFNVVRSTMAPFMMARSSARLVGANKFPSLVRWMKPSASVQLNPEFHRNLKVVLKRLHKAGVVSELQLRRFTQA